MVDEFKPDLDGLDYLLFVGTLTALQRAIEVTMDESATAEDKVTAWLAVGLSAFLDKYGGKLFGKLVERLIAVAGQRLVISPLLQSRMVKIARKAAVRKGHVFIGWLAGFMAKLKVDRRQDVTACGSRDEAVVYYSAHLQGCRFVTF